MSLYNLGAKGISLTKFCHVTCRKVGVIVCVQFFGGGSASL